MKKLTKQQEEIRHGTYKKQLTSNDNIAELQEKIRLIDVEISRFPTQIMVLAEEMRKIMEAKEKRTKYRSQLNRDLEKLRSKINNE